MKLLPLIGVLAALCPSPAAAQTHSHGAHGAPSHQGHGAPAYRAGAITVEAPWSRATPGGAKVAAGYMRIVNAGATPDRLVGGSASVAGRFEVHRSSSEGGVARMVPIEGGLVIPANGAVELKPGGDHAMLMDLRQPLKEGDVIKGTLVFEKAGPISVEYRVGGLGAGAPAGTAEHRH